MSDVPALIAAARQLRVASPPDQAQATTQATSAFLSLVADACRDPEARDPLGAADDVIQVLARALALGADRAAASQASHVACVTQAARAVGNLCFDHPANRGILREAGAVAALGAALSWAADKGSSGGDMEARNDDQEAQSARLALLRAVAGAVANMASDDAECQVGFRECGALPLLVDAAGRVGAKGNGAEQEDALASAGGSLAAMLTRALCNLSGLVANRKPLVDCGLVAALCGLVGRIAVDDDFRDAVLSDAVSLAWELLERETPADLRQVAIDQGVLQVFVFVVRVGLAENDLDTAASVVSALDDVCADAGAVSTAVARTDGLIPRLVDYVQWHLRTNAELFCRSSASDDDDDKQVRANVRQAVRVLASLSQDDNAHGLLLECALPWVLDTFLLRWKPEAPSDSAATDAELQVQQQFGAQTGVAASDYNGGVDTEFVLASLMMVANTITTKGKEVAALDERTFSNVLALLDAHPDLRVHHGAIGCLRNFSVDPTMRQQLLQLGYLEALLQQLKKTDRPNAHVVFGAIVALRTVVGAVASPVASFGTTANGPSAEERESAFQVVKLFRSGGGIQALIELAHGERARPEDPTESKQAGADEDSDGKAEAEADDTEPGADEIRQAHAQRDRRVEFEAARVLARLASATDTNELTRDITVAIRTDLIQPKAVAALLELVKAPYAVLQAEGLRAMRDLLGAIGSEHEQLRADLRAEPALQAASNSDESTTASLAKEVLALVG